MNVVIDAGRIAAVALLLGSAACDKMPWSKPPQQAARTATPRPGAAATKTAAAQTKTAGAQTKTAMPQTGTAAAPTRTVMPATKGATAQTKTSPATKATTIPSKTSTASKTAAPSTPASVVAQTRAAAPPPKAESPAAIAPSNPAPARVAAPAGPNPQVEAALDELSSRYATDFELHPGWFRDRSIQYYDFGPMLQPVTAGRVIWPIHGFDAHGNPVAIRGQHPLFSTLPGLPGYSGLWRLSYLIVADRAQPNAIKDVAGAEALARRHRAIMRPTDMVLNLPIVARGSHLTGDSTPPAYGWYAGHEVQYFDFGRSTLAPVPLFVFTRGVDAGGEPIFLREQSNIADTIPVAAPFPDVWAIQLVQVDSGYRPNTWRSGAAVLGEGARIESAHSLRNCPVVTRDGARLSRAPSPLRAFADDRSPFPPSPTIVTP